MTRTEDLLSCYPIPICMIMINDVIQNMRVCTILQTACLKPAYCILKINGLNLKGKLPGYYTTGKVHMWTAALWTVCEETSADFSWAARWLFTLPMFVNPISSPSCLSCIKPSCMCISSRTKQHTCCTQDRYSLQLLPPANCFPLLENPDLRLCSEYSHEWCIMKTDNKT